MSSGSAEMDNMESASLLVEDEV